MKTKTKTRIEVIVLLIIILIISLSALVFFEYSNAPARQIHENRKYDGELAKQLGYVPGQLIIQQGVFNVRTKEGLNEFKEFLKNESEKLTPIVIQKLIAEGKLNEGEVNDKFINRLKKSLITYDGYTGNGYEFYLIVVIDNAVTEVAEELVKEKEVKQAYENRVGILFNSEGGAWF